jgi:hypothetical protein
MALEFLFGMAILAIVVYVVFRVAGSIAIGALLVMAVFLASYLLVGSFPSLKDIPLIGSYIPTTGKVIAAIKDFSYSMDIIGVSQSSDNNLLVTVVNTGQSELSNFTAYVDENQIGILNNKESLNSGDVVVFELDWKDDFNRIKIVSDKAEATYEKK